MKKTNDRDNLLLEIGTEEIPARFMPEMLGDLKEKTQKLLKENGFDFSELKTLGTARRLILSVEGLLVKQPDVKLEVKGPPKERAYGPTGEPTQAALGFAQAQGADVKGLFVQMVGDKEYVFARVQKKGKFAKDVLATLLPALLKSLYLPISMRWGDGEISFIRPVQWIVALFGSSTIKFNFAGINSANVSQGHRYAAKKSFKVSSADKKAFLKLLKTNGVIADQLERRQMIEDGIVRSARKEGGAVSPNIALLEEVSFLVEYPNFVTGRFDPRFLSLPQAVLVTAMKKHQRYFPVFDSRGKLLPRFIVVIDSKKPLKVAGGNERVLVARLTDAKYFYEEDLKIKLADRVKDLTKITFYEKLGTLYDKGQRMKELALYLDTHLRANGLDKKLLERSAELCKADLSTQMVFEFPELQGEMGGEYAKQSGEPEQVWRAIQEHYLPRFAGDALPEGSGGILLSLADKLDSVVGCFAVGVIPTGSADPYGLRRQTQAIVQILVQYKLNIDLEDAFQKALKLWTHQFKNKYEVKPELVVRQLRDFFAARLKNMLLESGIRHDVTDAVLTNLNDPFWAAQVAKLLQRNYQSDWFKGVFQSADRCFRLGKKATRSNVIEADFIEPQEKQAFDVYLKVNWQVEEFLKKNELEPALREIVRLTPVLEEYFDKVMVMHDDERLRTNRLAFLKTLEKLYLQLADFSKLAI